MINVSMKFQDFCQIISRIIANFYNNSFIDVAKTESLAVELKLRSIKLPDELKVDKIIEWNTIPNITLAPGFKYNLLVMHILQLFAIMLLSRPFFIYEFSSNCNLMDKLFSSSKNMASQLCNASVKAAILTIKLIYYYMKSGTYRLELHVIVNCCGYAVLILGLRLLDKTVEGPNEEDVKEILEISLLILKLYSPHSPLADRLFEIVNLMLEALTETKIDAFPYPINIPDGQIFQQNFSPTSFTEVDYVADADNNLETLEEFQKYFVSNSFSPTNIMHHSSKEDPLNAQYANEAYSLCLGEKC